MSIFLKMESSIKSYQLFQKISTGIFQKEILRKGKKSKKLNENNQLQVFQNIFWLPPNPAF